MISQSLILPLLSVVALITNFSGLYFTVRKLKSRSKKKWLDSFGFMILRLTSSMYLRNIPIHYNNHSVQSNNTEDFQKMLENIRKTYYDENFYCLFIIDNSLSMAEKGLSDIREALTELRGELLADPQASQKVKLGFVTFSPADKIHFNSVKDFDPPQMMANGDSPIGRTIVNTLTSLEEWIDTRRIMKLSSKPPFVVLITDAQATDDITEAKHLIQRGHENNRFKFITYGIEGADMKMLAELCGSEPLNRISMTDIKVPFEQTSGMLRRLAA